MHMFGYSGMGSGNGFGMVFMFLFWAIVIVFIVSLIRSITRRSDPKEKESALEIAKKRYAKGELSKEEFDRLARDLR